MRVFNVFHLEHMPDESTAQDATVEKIFTVRNMHVHGENGYFLVRCTEITPIDGVVVTKLDPAEDAEAMSELVQIYLDNQEKLS